MNQIKARRAKLQASESDDSDSEADDDPFASSNPTRITTVHGTSSGVPRRPSVIAAESASPRHRRQSLFGSAPLSNLANAQTSKADTVKYRRGSVISNVAPPTEPKENESVRTEVDTYDLTQLPDPSHSNILAVLDKRWHDGFIYTSVGNCLISVNPYRWIESLYNPKVIEGCLAVSQGAENFPHVYQIANDAYYALKTTGHAQSIVIAGESGSGKTENMKKCLQFFTRIALGEKVVEGGNGNSSTTNNLECRILATNPLLEALGNATTSRNDNSSRFGRWIEISFKKGKVGESGGGSGGSSGASPIVNGCQCQSYLLEKSRVTQQQLGDRNFHIFYMLLSGASTERKEQLSLTEPFCFHYMGGSSSGSGTGSGTYTTAKDEERYKEFLEAAHKVNLSKVELDSILLLVASCLHLGNVEFNSTDPSSCQVHSSDGRAERALTVAATMLGIDSTELSTSMCFRTIQMRSSGEEMKVPMGKEKATAARDALSKSIYSKLFTWLVARLNQTLIVPTEGGSGGSGGSGLETSVGASSVGILDIFGFEIMNINEFEQLCINYVNENCNIFSTNIHLTKKWHCTKEKTFKYKVPSFQPILP